ncbi:RNA-binding motif protein [Vairimorpha necatrix]|uniref:RNA-binding motif protein n=1 Tax=Vairimorpha necatrix TaxID=6039 RepID=A0AAX4JB57_9MICR
MYKIMFFLNIKRESLYCLLIQFSPIKDINSKHLIVEYYNKKDMNYSLEMINETKINGKYIKYKILNDTCIYKKPNTKYLEIFEKFRTKKVGEKIRFENEEEMEKVREILKKEYVNHKKIKIK